MYQACQVVIITNNELDGDGTSAGVGLEADGGFGASDTALTATHNYIRNWGTGVVIYLCDSSVYTCASSGFANVDIHLNSLTGNVDDGLVNLNAPHMVNGEDNWWGRCLRACGCRPRPWRSGKRRCGFRPVAV